MNVKEDFKSFILSTVIPNTPSYCQYFNDKNIDNRIDELEEKYNESFETKLFNIEDEENVDAYADTIKKNINSGEQNSFSIYSAALGSNVPSALLNKHFSNFLKYFTIKIEFNDFQQLIDILHKELGNKFISDFKEKRRNYNGQSKIVDKGILYGEVRDNYWTINKGATKEIQYHMFYDGKQIGYGLAFNAQPSKDNRTPLEYVIPFIKSYKTNEIIKEIPDYFVIAGDSKMLKNINISDFVCIGKTIPVNYTSEGIGVISGLDFLELIYNHKGKQFNAYKKIFQGRNDIINSSKTMSKEFDLLLYKKQIILQGAPGTGKTYTTAELALRVVENNKGDYSNRKDVVERYKKAVNEAQIVFTTFHQSLDYEEFIEGIKPISEGKEIAYDIMPGIFKKICKNAIQKDSIKELQDAIEKFKEKCASATEDIILETVEKGRFTVTYRGGITFRVRSLKSQAKEGQDFPASVENIEKLYKGELKGIYNKSYVWGILNYLKNEYKIPEYKGEDNSDKNYVLIIDEINRGNISKIFGELITLLEADKRIGGDNPITCTLPYSQKEDFGIPDNLYIIGTMNTTDRSLGHIDYAVRRRFGFVTLESDSQKIETFYKEDEDLKKKAISIFDKVKNLIKDNNSPEFQEKDIMVGHSYFMAKDIDELDLKLKYEIKPLLEEYIKDGILTIAIDDIATKLSSIKYD